MWTSELGGLAGSFILFRKSKWAPKDASRYLTQVHIWGGGEVVLLSACSQRRTHWAQAAVTTTVETR